MFKKLKEKIADEVKTNPRLQGTLDSVNQLAAQTYSAFNKEGSGSRESLSSLTSQLSLTTAAVESSFTSDKHQENGSSSDLLSFGSPATVTAASISSSSGQFFSLGEDDEPVSLSNNNSPAKTPTPPTGLNMTSTPAPRGRRSSSSSTDAALFPIYEDPLQDSMPLFSDLESMAGSEAGWGDDSSAQLGAVSKEQLMNMLSKMRGRYHKYKGRYTDLAKAYRELEGENKKVKEVMQQTQDKALRRISELKEQGSLEKQAKAHLEEELRAELEEKQHIITTLNTKVALLKKEHVEEQPVASTLIDLSADSGNHDDIENGDKNNGRISESEKGLQLPEVDNMSVKSEDSEKLYHLEDKVKRLESLLSKCKENIKANKNKLSALTEVKEQLAVDLEAKEKELNNEKAASKKAVDELQLIKNREEGDELQMAEAKLAMHREMIMKDEEIGELRVSFNREKEEKETLEKNIEDLHKEIKEMGAAQETLEKRMEEERKSAMEELSRGKEAALDQERQRLETEKKKEVARELERQGDEWRKKIKEVEEEGRLGREELELRLSAVSKLEDKNKNKTLESTILKLETEKNKLVDQLNLSKKQILELEATKNSMNEMKAGKIIMEAKLKDVLSDMDVKKTKIIELEKTLKDLTTSSTEKLNDKDKELSERLETMAKMEDSIKEHKEKVESVEKQLKYAHEEHKNNLENLKTQLLQNENLESSQIDIMVESHKTEIGEKENEIKKLHESLLTVEESAKELQERLNYNLESSMKTEEEFETKIQSLEETMRSTEANLCTTESNLKEAEENISLKAEDLRDANEKVEDLQIHLEKMQNYEAKAKECKDFLDQKVHELRDANEELEEFKRIADEKSSLKIDLEKELHSLKEQVNSRQALHDQMVGYEKELHNRISTLENEKSGLIKVREELEDRVKSQENDIASIKQANEDEICRLKQDLEMKMRNEREKENSHKEFQKQSIEYEKKLQDQLEDKNQMVDEYKKDFERKKKELTALKESYEKEINSLERKLNEMSKNISQREMEAKNMNEKCEQLENILDEKEKLVESLEHTQTEHLSRVKTLEAELANLVENRKQLNDIIEENQKEVASLKDNQIEMEKIQTENKKLSKSRDRLKSLLDEKEKAFTDLQGEKEKLSGSREEIDSQMKVKVASLRDEIGKLNEIKESLVTEGNELKNNLEIVTQQASNSNLEYEKVFKEVEILKEHNKHLNSEKDILVDDKSKIDLEFKTLSEDHKNLVIELEELKVGVEKNVQLKIDLMQANNELKASADEVSNFKLKLKEVEGMSNLSELKEENAMLIERVSQYEDEKCQIEKLSEDKWRSENEKVDHFYQREKKKLEKQIENYKIEIEILQSRDMNEETEDKIKSLVKELERKMAIMDSEHQEEIEQLQENHEIEMNRANSEHKELVGKLSSDLREKMDQFEIMDLEHQTSLRMIKEEVSEQIQLRDLKHAQALEEMNSNHKINISALEEDVHKRSGDWGWDEHQELEDLSGDSPAIFGVPNNTPHPANKGLPIKCEPSMVLEDYPEFEYLRNILYEYMLGRQPLILVKVLAAIVKFSPDQVSAIVKAEERKQSYLTSLGLS